MENKPIEASAEKPVVPTKRLRVTTIDISKQDSERLRIGKKTIYLGNSSRVVRKATSS